MSDPPRDDDSIPNEPPTKDGVPDDLSDQTAFYRDDSFGTDSFLAGDLSSDSLALSHARIDSIIDKAQSEAASILDPPPKRKKSRPLPKVEGYEILEQLGQGAMGVVYKARQKGLKRLVALKMILAGSHAGDMELVRFKTEAEAVARLQHPNIVQVHEIGEWQPDSGSDSLPYLSIEYVSGGTLAQYLRGTPQPPRVAAEIVRSLAEAIQYAHDHNVVHRDLKPSNILLDVGEEGNLSGGSVNQSAPTFGSTFFSERSTVGDSANLNPKIADFGLAKQLDEQSSQTMSGAIVGTPSYMAPEQATGKQSLVGPAADIYALGAILYEILSGRPPFKGASLAETLEQVRHQEPVPLSQLQAKIPIDIETICLKCLQKDIGKRYSSARELSLDLGRFLADKPILARPVGNWERAHRWCRRNPFPAALIAGIALTLVLGTVVSTYFAFRALRGELEAIRQTKIAIEEKLESDYRRYVAEYVLAGQKWQDGRIGETIELLQGLLPKSATDRDLTGFEWNYLNRLCSMQLQTLYLPGHDDENRQTVMAMATSSDGKWLATAGTKMLIWDRVSGTVKHELSGFGGMLYCVSISADGKLVAAGGFDKLVHVWNMETGLEEFKLEGHQGPVRSITFCPFRNELASGAFNDVVKVWNLDNRPEHYSLPRFSGSRWGIVYAKLARSLFITVRTVDAESNPISSIVMVDCDTKKERTIHSELGSTIYLAASCNRERLVSYSRNKVRVWKVTDGLAELEDSFEPQIENVNSIAISPDGKKIAICGEGPVYVWDVELKREIARHRGHSSGVTALQYSPDGWQLLSANDEGRVLVWDANYSLNANTFKGADGTTSASLSTDGSRIATLSNDGMIRVFETSGTRREYTLAKSSESSVPVCIAFLPDSLQLAVITAEGRVLIVDSTDSKWILVQDIKQELSKLVVSPDGKWLATVANQGSVVVIRLSDGSIADTFHLTLRDNDEVSLAFHPTKPWIAISQEEKKELIVRDFLSNEQFQVIAEHGGRVVAFSPDGKYAVFGSKLTLVDLAAKKPVRDILKRQSFALTLNYDPTGKRLMMGGSDRLVRLVDSATGSDLLTFGGHPQPIMHVEMSANQQLLASIGQDGFIQYWNASPADNSIDRQAFSLNTFLADQEPDKQKRSDLIGRNSYISEEVRKRAMELNRGDN